MRSDPTSFDFLKSSHREKCDPNSVEKKTYLTFDGFRASFLATLKKFEVSILIQKSNGEQCPTRRNRVSFPSRSS